MSKKKTTMMELTPDEVKHIQNLRENGKNSKKKSKLKREYRVMNREDIVALLRDSAREDEIINMIIENSTPDGRYNAIFEALTDQFNNTENEYELFQLITSYMEPDTQDSILLNFDDENWDGVLDKLVEIKLESEEAEDSIKKFASALQRRCGCKNPLP